MSALGVRESLVYLIQKIQPASTEERYIEVEQTVAAQAVEVLEPSVFWERYTFDLSYLYE